MMNFELIDNLFQVTALFSMALASAVLAWRKKERQYVILMLFYACFAMGTSYFVLYLAVIGNIPQVFYVSEVSWLASYLFLLSLQIVRTEHMHIRGSWKAGAVTAIIVTGSFAVQIFGPSWFMVSAFACTAGTLAYLTVFRLQSRKKSLTDVCILTSVSLQVLLYIVSCFLHDYTRFNLYFAVDFILTASFMALLPLLHREVEKE